MVLKIFQQTRHKVSLPGSHPFEYFKNTWKSSHPRAPTIHHPPRVINQDTQLQGPLYFKITLRRSLIGVLWSRRYTAGVLFKKYSPDFQVRPKYIRPNISVGEVIFREATPEIAKLVLELKELVDLENVWTEEEYRSAGKALLGKAAMTADEHSQHRGYRVIGNVANAPLFPTILKQQKQQ